MESSGRSTVGGSASSARHSARTTPQRIRFAVRTRKRGRWRSAVAASTRISDRSTNVAAAGSGSWSRHVAEAVSIAATPSRSKRSNSIIGIRPPRVSDSANSMARWRDSSRKPRSATWCAQTVIDFATHARQHRMSPASSSCAESSRCVRSRSLAGPVGAAGVLTHRPRSTSIISTPAQRSTGSRATESTDRGRKPSKSCASA